MGAPRPLPAAPAGPRTQALRTRAHALSARGSRRLTGGGQGGWGPRRVMPGGAGRFPHLRKRVHRPGLRVSIARRRRRWFKFRKRKEVSPGSACLRERTRSPGSGHSSQPALLPPAASSVGLGLRLPFKFEFQRREPRACVGGGAGRASPRPRTGSRGRGGREVPRTGPLPQLSPGP